MNRRHFVLGAATAAAAGRAASANDRIAVAVIGCGMRGLIKEALQFGPACNVAVTAVCDTWRQRREEAAAAVRAAGQAAPEAFVHYQDVLALKSVDAVLISTPDHQHCTQLAAAMRAGKDAYVEKPLAMEMKELVDAVDAVKKSGRVVQCGSQMRSAASAAAGKAFVAAGGLGKILKIEQSRNGYKPYWYSRSVYKVAEADVDWRAFLMHKKHRPWDADQYLGWYGYREFSRGPHAGYMSHFTDLLHFVTGARYPRRAVALGGIFRWKDAHTAPDSIEVVLEYDEGFLVRYNTTFGTSANSYMKFIGTRGVMDSSRWNATWTLSGEAAEPDGIRPGATLPPAPESTHHMRNWFDCLRSRKQPIAPIDAGFGHAVACIMADEAFIRGTRMVFDPVKRVIREG